MNYKEFREKYGKLDRAMLKLMLGIGPSKYDRSFSSVTMQATGIGAQSKKIVFNEKTTIKMFLDLRIVRKGNDNLYLRLSESKKIEDAEMDCIDNATVMDLKTAKLIEKWFNLGEKIKKVELENVIK